MKSQKIKILLSIIMLIIFILLSSTVYGQDDIIVILDPGHGGSDVGAIGGGIYESDINWKIAKRVKEILDQTPGIKGILTRAENENPSLYDRGIKARDNNANLLVSFHINSSATVNTLSGSEVYITANTNQKRYYEYSNILGLDILSNLSNVGVTPHIYRPIIKSGQPNEWYEDGFIADYYGIIRNPMYYGIPGVLIEHCYINNSSDRANFLSSDEKINAMAEADAKAIIKNKELFRKSYYGQINTVLNSMELIKGANGDNYLSGNIDIAELINDSCNTPKGTPLLTLKSTDGTVSKKIYSYWLKNTTYYYDINVDSIAPNKEYYIEAYLTGSDNIAPTKNKTQKVLLPGKTFGGVKNGTLNVNNNLVYFEYKGEISTTLKNAELIQSNEKPYLAGKVKVEEIINGNVYSIIDTSNLKFILKSTDGSFSKKLYSYYQGDKIFYFDTRIDELDKKKTYHIIAQITNLNNIANDDMKIKELDLEERTIIGKVDELHLLIENNIFRITEQYQGSIKTQLETINMNDNGSGRHYIFGNIQISEIVDGENKVPSTLPSLTLKTKAGYEQKMYIYHSGNGNYYFDTYIEDLDKVEQYYIEAKLTNRNNVASEEDKTVQVELPEKELGKTKEYKVYTKNGMIQFIDINIYEGTIETKLNNISMQSNNDGRHYIFGNIQISEIIDGVAKIPSTLPQLLLKTDNGYSQKMYIYHSEYGNYYFDTYIEELDLEEEYYIEAKLTNEKNIAEDSKKVQEVTIRDQELGKMQEKKVVIKNSKLKFTDGDKYIGIISTKIDGIYLNDNGAGKYYISGNIRISEIIENVVNVPNALPELLLKTEDGFSKKMYIYHSGNGNYYFDTYIEDLDLGKKYYIEASLTNTKNIAEISEKTQVVTIKEKELGRARERKVVIKNNKLQFMELEKYQASIYTKLDGIYLNDNGAGRHYISGNIQIKQVIDGKASTCTTLPQLILKGENGYEQKMYIYHSGNGNYYFDTYIEDLDTTQRYYIEASLTDENNNIEESKKKQILMIYNKELGKIKQDSILVSIENSKLTFNFIQTTSTTIESNVFEENKVEGEFINAVKKTEEGM